MKIVSRNDEDNTSTVTIGSGNVMLLLTDRQLELIMGLLASCRLGKSSGNDYKDEAFELLTMFENDFSQDVIDAAVSNVIIGATIEDNAGTITYRSGVDEYVTLEV